jgi:DNA-binding response OmpR family regulator
MTRTILIVNGSPERRRSSRDVLERAGYRVREVLSMETAAAFARRARPLAVVVEAPDDLAVAERFAERLRHHPVTQAVPVLVLAPEATMAAEPLAGVSWLAEPCPPRSLLDEVAYLTRPRAPVGPAFGTAPEVRGG